jgi:hypothetical protein
MDDPLEGAVNYDRGCGRDFRGALHATARALEAPSVPKEHL